MRGLLTVVIVALLAYDSSGVEPQPPVIVHRLPNGAVQPEIVVDPSGRIHMTYLAGDPAAADVFYVSSDDGGKTFSPPLRVNSQAGSGIATGTVRGAHLTRTASGRIHVAWNGSATAMTKPMDGAKASGMPMLYSRSNLSRTAFEPQRNLMRRTTTLDGGGAIASSGRRVYVAWHANAAGEAGEGTRRVWIADSTDDGKTFSSERPVSDSSTGVCGCCSLAMAVRPDGAVQLLYRAATAQVHRDMFSLVSTNQGGTFTSARLHPWEIGACPMTTASIVTWPQTYQAWETGGQVFMSGGPVRTPVSPPASTGTEPRRKHPRIAVNRDGIVLMVWADGTAWARGGSVGWQRFASTGAALDTPGAAPTLPAWSFPAVAALPDGSFVVFY